MEITSSINNIYSSNSTSQTVLSNKTKSINDIVNITDSFSILENKKIEANDYTYNEYKKLSAKDINEIFPWNKMPYENEKAHKLQLLATLSPDETLNETLFDKAKNSDFNNISTRNFFDRTLASAELEKALVSSYENDTSKEGIESFKKGYINSIVEMSEDERKNFLKKEGFDTIQEFINYTKSTTVNLTPLAKNIDGIVDAKSYFQFYETSKNYLKEYGNQLSEYSKKHLIAEYNLFDEIKNEYEKKVSQNNIILNQLTKNLSIKF